MKYMTLILFILLLPSFKASAQSLSVDSLKIVYEDFSTYSRLISCDEISEFDSSNNYRKLHVTEEKKCNKLYSLLKYNVLREMYEITARVRIFVYLSDHTKDTLCISSSDRVMYRGQLFNNDKLVTYTKKLIKSLDKNFTGSWEEAIKEFLEKNKNTK